MTNKLAGYELNALRLRAFGVLKDSMMQGPIGSRLACGPGRSKRCADNARLAEVEIRYRTISDALVKNKSPMDDPFGLSCRSSKVMFLEPPPRIANTDRLDGYHVRATTVNYERRICSSLAIMSFKKVQPCPEGAISATLLPARSQTAVRARSFGEYLSAVYAQRRFSCMRGIAMRVQQGCKLGPMP